MPIDDDVDFTESNVVLGKENGNENSIYINASFKEVKNNFTNFMKSKLSSFKITDVCEVLSVYKCNNKGSISKINEFDRDYTAINCLCEQPCPIKKEYITHAKKTFDK